MPVRSNSNTYCYRQCDFRSDLHPMGAHGLFSLTLRLPNDTAS